MKLDFKGRWQKLKNSQAQGFMSKQYDENQSDSGQSDDRRSKSRKRTRIPQLGG